MKRSDPPCPRGSHSASIIGDDILFFGGYRRLGHTRKDFSDLHVLCLKSWEWYTIETTGFQSVALDDKIYIMGGWNTLEQFDDLHVLDTKSFLLIGDQNDGTLMQHLHFLFHSTRFLYLVEILESLTQ